MGSLSAAKQYMSARNAQATSSTRSIHSSSELRPMGESSTLGNRTDTTSRDRRNSSSIEAESIEDKFRTSSDCAEAFMARQWSKGTRSDVYAAASEDDTTCLAQKVSIAGVERKRKQDSTQWWYLTLPLSLTFNPADFGGRTEVETPYGFVDINVPLENGYRMVAFLPKWKRCRDVPLRWRSHVWSRIGSKFWRFTSARDDNIRWLREETQYWNLSRGWSEHLCDGTACRECS